jgi:hypothetical protein
MGTLDTTKWVKPFELEIPKSVHWKALRELESKFGCDFKTTWDWALRGRKIVFYAPIVPFVLVVFLCFATFHPNDFSFSRFFEWVVIGVVWTFMIAFWLTVLERWLDISRHMRALGQSIWCRRTTARSCL